ncbi:MAG: glycogen synthase GlgA [Planctomycetes bacterium]|nr:glycogen synthase GlgA [Planctomycetota bacterium]
MRVLHVAMECLPFSKVGGMADVTGALPAVLKGAGVESRVMTPYYPQIYKGALGREIGAFDVWVGSAAHRVRLFETEPFGILVDQPTAYDRAGVYDDPASGKGYGDNLFRCLVLCQAARAAVRQGIFAADVVHCHDNHTAFVPVYLKDDGGPPSVYTIHNFAYQGIYGAQDFWLTGLDPKRFHGHSAFEYFGDLNLMKAGISFADLVTTVSPSYAKEIVTPEHGHGLDGVLRHLGDRLVGILNGIDEKVWDPADDPHLPAGYSAAKPAGKEKCKEALRARAGLEIDPQAPIVGLVSRFTHQKGIDLLGSNLPWLVRAGAQVAVLGNGDAGLLDLFRGAQGRWPGRVALLEGYDEALAHLVYAGTDIFCMPSRFEPCGLSQMYAMRYGSVPVTTKMGGLKDTVLPFDEERRDGTGILADWATADSLQGALDYALTLWKKPQLFRMLRKNGMLRDFSWKRSAEQYAAAYERVRRK